MHWNQRLLSLKANYQTNQARSPRILRASWMSLGMIVTLFACIAQRLVSSKRPTRYASAASCSARTAWLWNLRSVLKSCAISLTSLWNGSFLIKSSVLFWYFRISLQNTQPIQNMGSRTGIDVDVCRLERNLTWERRFRGGSGGASWLRQSSARISSPPIENTMAIRVSNWRTS